jgi:hypothetical protein
MKPGCGSFINCTANPSFSGTNPFCAKSARTHLEAYYSVQISYRLDELVDRFEKRVLEVVLDIDLPAVLAFDFERWRKGFTAPEECAAESESVSRRQSHRSFESARRSSLHGCAGKLLVS